MANMDLIKVILQLANLTWAHWHRKRQNRWCHMHENFYWSIWSIL